MPKPRELPIFDRKLRLTDVEFDIKAAYKVAKDFAEDRGYDFLEEDQVNKAGKYGHKMEFKFGVTKEVDPFAKQVITVEMKFDALKLLKNGHYRGDLLGDVKGKLILDWRNEYGGSKLMTFFFELYLKVFKQRVKDQYIGPLFITSDALYNKLKAALDLYG